MARSKTKSWIVRRLWRTIASLAVVSGVSLLIIIVLLARDDLFILNFAVPVALALPSVACPWWSCLKAGW